MSKKNGGDSTKKIFKLVLVLNSSLPNHTADVVKRLCRRLLSSLPASRKSIGFQHFLKRNLAIVVRIKFLALLLNLLQRNVLPIALLHCLSIVSGAHIPIATTECIEQFSDVLFGFLSRVCRALGTCVLRDLKSSSGGCGSCKGRDQCLEHFYVFCLLMIKMV